MSLSEEAIRLTYGMAPEVRAAVLEIARELMAEFSCDDHVKTIYIGFSVGGEMVAAAYPQGKACDIALALSENHPSSDLEDATHLTWPTLPVLVRIVDLASGARAIALAREAATRVTSGAHDIRRPADYFRERKGRGAQNTRRP